MCSTHLPSDDPECVDVAGLCTFGANKPEALRVNQLWSGTVEEPVNVDPRHGRWNRSCSKAGYADAPIGVDEDVLLGDRERTIKR